MINENVEGSILFRVIVDCMFGLPEWKGLGVVPYALERRSIT